jgi:CRP-like cAMP-binding protein
VSFATKRNPAIERMRPLRALCGSTDRELAQIDRLTYELHAPAGAVLIKEGDSPSGFFLIVSGRAEVSVAGGRCGELGPGAFFGETAMLDRGPEPATVTALTPTVVRVASRREFRELAEIRSVAHTMLLTLVTRQRVGLANGTCRPGVDSPATEDARTCRILAISS